MAPSLQTLLRTSFAVTGLALLSACQTAPVPPTSPEVIGEFNAGRSLLNGYLDRKTVPNSLVLLPQPPAEGSADYAADLAAYTSSRSLRGTARWDLAAADAVLKFPQAASGFACTLDVPISPEQTPHLSTLLRRMVTDAGLSTYGAKVKYQRKRPFVVQGDSTCTPADEKHLANDGSYPSGHAAVGWAWALVLSEIAPDRSDAMLARGYAFGQSRVICGAHWQSDVTAGRVMGAATVARLHADPIFVAQMVAAKAELADAKAKGLHAGGNCQAQAQALGQP